MTSPQYVERFAMVPLRKIARKCGSNTIRQAIKDFEVCHADENEAHDVQNLFHRETVSQEERFRVSTYLFIDEALSQKTNVIKIAGFFSIFLYPIDFSRIPKKYQDQVDVYIDKIGGHDVVLAYYIGAMARSKDYSNPELPGGYLLNGCLNAINNLRCSAGGSQIIIADCSNRLFDKVHHYHGWTQLPVTDASKSADNQCTIIQFANPKKLKVDVACPLY
jgi:hypothetical protein